MNKGITRRSVIEGAAAGALAAATSRRAHALLFPRGGAAAGAVGPSGLPTTVAISAMSAAVPNNSYVRFGHLFGASDLPSGKTLSITDDLSASVPYTAMARSTAGGTATRFGDNVVRVPNGMSAPLTVSSITHSGTTATATTAAAHGLSSGAWVNMYQCVPDDYVGLVQITSTGANTFTYVMQTTPASNATTPGVMCYTRLLTLNATTGSWNNTLPNSKTVSALITDATTNFDNYTLTLSSVRGSNGLTVASGTFNADLATALAATGTSRALVSRQGQLVCDLLGIMQFNDSVTPTTHLGSMSAWFYVTLFLDQTTGAVQELRCRVYIDNSLANVAMDYYTYQATLKLGSTVIRSTGLSSNAAIDGKVQSFAASAINTTTGVINIPNHGFVGGETAKFTTTGALPAAYTNSVPISSISWNAGAQQVTVVTSSSLNIPLTSGVGAGEITGCTPAAYNGYFPVAAVDSTTQIRYLQATNPGTATVNGTFVPEYAVIWVDTNNIMITTTFDENLQLGHSVPFIPATQGTGTHTITCWMHSPYRSRIPYVAADGKPDRWTGKTGTLSPQSDHVAHTNSYLQATKMVPPVDLTINLPARAAFRTSPSTNFGNTASYSALDQFCFGGFGSLAYQQNQGGAGAFHEYGGPWTDKCLRRLRYTYDPGLAQTLRVDAMMMGAFDIALVNDSSTWRMACVNNGPARNGVAYTGLPTPAPNSCFGIGQTFLLTTGFTTPTSQQRPNGTTAVYSFSHRYILYPRLYAFEGGQDIHDMLMMDANTTILGNTAGISTTFPTTAQISAKNYLISGTTYYTLISGSEPRTDAWSVQVYWDAKFLGDETCVEKPYILDLGSDWIFVANWLNNTFAPSVDPNFSVVGGWPHGETARHGPGNTYAGQCDSITEFYQDYLGETWGHCFRMDNANTTFSSLLTSFFTLIDLVARNNTSNGFMCNTYSLRIKQAAGSAANATQTIAVGTVPMLEDSNLSHVVGLLVFTTGGVVIGATVGVIGGVVQPGGFTNIPPQNGDQHYITDTDAAGTLTPGEYNAPAAELYNTYFVQSASGTYQGGWMYGTSAGSGTITSYPAFSSSTLNGGITNVATTLTTNAVISFPLTDFGSRLLVIDSEVMIVTGGVGTTTLTVLRGQYGTSAVSHSNAASTYCPYSSTLYVDYQNRTVSFPPTGHVYRLFQAALTAPDGYITMARASAFYSWLLAKNAKTAFNNLNQWFNDPSRNAGEGPDAFAANNTLKDSVNTTFTS